MEDTLAYDYGRYGTQYGWVTRYSFKPEWMESMNGELYTFKNGEIFKHNSNSATVNNFYGTQYSSVIKTTINEFPNDVKMFKTLSLDSDDSWDAIVLSDLMSGVIDKSSFIEKEGDFLAYIRRVDSNVISDEDSRRLSTQGIGTSNAYGANVISFAFDIDTNSISVGDLVYKISGGAIVLVGEVDAFTSTTITMTNVVSTVVPPDFILIGKNKVAESNGVRGYYMDVTLENDTVNQVELFSVTSSIFKSFP